MHAAAAAFTPLRMFPPSFVATADRSRDVVGRRRRLAPPLKPAAARPVTFLRRRAFRAGQRPARMPRVTDGQAPRSGSGDADLEYDLAHEAVADHTEGAWQAPGPAPHHPPGRHERGAVVATEAADSAGDYGYDLVHEIPRQRRDHPLTAGNT